jgi:hypothetical protein
MKVPTTGTEVFSPNTTTNDSVLTTTNFPVDFFIESKQSSTGDKYVGTRMLGNFALKSNTTDAAVETFNSSLFQSNIGVRPDLFGAVNSVIWNFRRAPNFFDVVCYTGDGVNGRFINHNLGVTPTVILCKRRDSASNWTAYMEVLGTGYFFYLNSTNAAGASNYVNGTVAANNSSTVYAFNPGGSSITDVNTSGGTYVMYLFASCDGVSKVGSYTGNGSSQTINCGFTGGARFVLIRRTDSTGDWVVLDTARGIVSGNDPFLQLNLTDTEVTGEDIVDPDSSGFIVNSTTENINASGGTYIYLAIA